VVAADVLEHLRQPERLLEQIRSVLGSARRSDRLVPNFGHWYSRGRTALGLFDYDQRGILDNGHVRFFTRRGLLRRLRNAGFTVVREEATCLPFEVLTRRQGAITRIVRFGDRIGVALRPTLFGYQFVCKCETAASPSVIRSRQ